MVVSGQSLFNILNIDILNIEYIDNDCNIECLLFFYSLFF